MRWSDTYKPMQLVKSMLEHETGRVCSIFIFRNMISIY